MLLDRLPERAALSELLDAARAGRSGVLVMRGEPGLDKLEGLPDPQRAAPGVAFGLSTGAAPDRFLVGLAALGLLSVVAEQQQLPPRLPFDDLDL